MCLERRNKGSEDVTVGVNEEGDSKGGDDASGDVSVKGLAVPGRGIRSGGSESLLTRMRIRECDYGTIAPQLWQSLYHSHDTLLKHGSGTWGTQLRLQIFD